MTKLSDEKKLTVAIGCDPNATELKNIIIDINSLQNLFKTLHKILNMLDQQTRA